MKKVVLSSMLGNGLEWYDFALYAFMTSIISQLFFPPGDESVRLLATFGIFAVGFVARPFGAVLFGIIGDRYGRRVSLSISIVLIALSTGCIGLLPTYAQIGIWAPILLTIVRLLQGLSLGGEFSGSMTYLVEHAPAQRRALIGSASMVSLAMGFLLGSLVAQATRYAMPLEAFENWGWRIPFLLGILVGIVGFYIRHQCAESPIYEQACQSKDGLSQTPMREVLRHYRSNALKATGIYITVTMPFYLLSTYFITLTERTLGHSHDEAMQLNTINMLVFLCAAPCSALLADRYGRKNILLAVAVGFLLLSAPIFTLLLRPGLMNVMLAEAAFALLVGLYVGPVPAILVELFPTRIRYCGMALAYNVAAVIFGGTAPMACQWLIEKTGSIYSIVAYVMLCSVVSIVALASYKDRWREAL